MRPARIFLLFNCQTPGMDYPLKDTKPLTKAEAIAARKIILDGICAFKLEQRKQ